MYFVFLVTGLALGIGLLIVWIGVPIPGDARKRRELRLNHLDGACCRILLTVSRSPFGKCIN